MLKIAVCDDDEVFGKHVLSLLAQNMEIPAEMVYFQNGACFLQEGENTDILFLDIDMPDMSGMELARALQEKRKAPVLVFLTALPEYVYDAFETEAIGYLLKPIEEEKFIKVLKRAIQKAETSKQEQHICIKSNGQVRRLSVEDILYVENQGRKLLFHTKKTIFTCYGKMEEYERQLPDYFFRCHRGYLVSLKEVASYERNAIYLSNGEMLLMAKQKYPAFLEACIKWLR